MIESDKHKDVSELFYNDPEKGKRYEKEINQAVDSHEHQHRGLFMKSDEDGEERREKGP